MLRLAFRRAAMPTGALNTAARSLVTRRFGAFSQPPPRPPAAGGERPWGAPLRASHFLVAGVGAGAGALLTALYYSSISAASHLDPPAREAYGGGALTASAAVLRLPPGAAHEEERACPPTVVPAAIVSSGRGGDRGAPKVLTEDSIADAAERVAPSVVNLTVTYAGSSGVYMGKSSGSGLILTESGDIVTNAHVVVGNSRFQRPPKIEVHTQDGRTFEGTLVSHDAVADLALVRVASAAPLPAAPLGSSAALRVGQWVVALGSPLHLQNSVTAGIISCVDRKGSDIGLRGTPVEYIQTDAAINQGNSGGPLVDLSGAVIGINVMKALAADGVSFAIPIDVVKGVVEQLRRHGRVVRPFLGMKMLELNAHNAAQLRARDAAFPHVAAGVLIPQVHPGTPAERGGLSAGDVIVEFGGRRVETAKDIMDVLGYQAGKTFAVKVLRAHGKEVVLSVTSEEAAPL